MQNDDADIPMPGKPACPPVGESELWLFFCSSPPLLVLRKLLDGFLYFFDLTAGPPLSIM